MSSFLFIFFFFFFALSTFSLLQISLKNVLIFSFRHLLQLIFLFHFYDEVFHRSPLKNLLSLKKYISLFNHLMWCGSVDLSLSESLSWLKYFYRRYFYSRMPYPAFLVFICMQLIFILIMDYLSHNASNSFSIFFPQRLLIVILVPFKHNHKCASIGWHLHIILHSLPKCFGLNPYTKSFRHLFIFFLYFFTDDLPFISLFFFCFLFYCSEFWIC